MDAIDLRELQDSFVNCSKTQRKRIPLPAASSGIRWADLDFLGWLDPQSPERAYLVVPMDGRPAGIVLRRAQPGAGQVRKSMCAMCLTVHPGSGVTMFAAARAGASGRAGNTVGSYLCSDLRCSLYVRGIALPDSASTMAETLDVDTKVLRLQERIRAFVSSVLDPAA